MIQNNRTPYLDHLRVLAAVAVIVIHITNQAAAALDARSFQWQALNILNSLSRWCVPVFLMISGSLFLCRDIPLKTLYSKYIARLAVAYGIWSAIYALAMPVKNLLLQPDYQISLQQIYTDLILGQSHMWFLPMMIGIYMCLPVFRLITGSEKATGYYLLLSFLSAFLIPQILDVCSDLLGASALPWIDPIRQLLSGMYLQLVAGYGFYFVLGWWLSRAELSKTQQTVIYALGVTGFLATILLNGLISWHTHTPYKHYYSNHSVNVALQAVAVFTWFRCRKLENKRLNGLICRLAQASFGVYLGHNFILRILSTFGLDSSSVPPLLYVPVLSVIVTVISFGCACLLRKVPFCRKWIV